MPLAQYAAEHWIDHAKLGGVDPIVLQLILRFFTESAPLKIWIEMYSIDAGGWGEISMDVAKVGSALYYSSLAGMQDILDCLPHRGENANAEGGRLGNALQAEGYDMIVKLLLENEANVNAKGGKYGNALQAALWEGNEAIVKLLLENGAEVNAEGGEHGNTLQVASFALYEAIVKLLLNNGAEINAALLKGDLNPAL